MPFWSRPDLFAGRRVIHFMDNTAALSALANGYSRKPDLAQLVNLYHVAVVALGCEQGSWQNLSPSKFTTDKLKI